ncbi:hypothetical protein AMECASPLE_036392 [Ameca splendens]|uniref:Uncharacterized protein n=1 Tax=Ameca splendens TaxID=208324 RepID=A0ABV0ZGD4_9TELE
MSSWMFNKAGEKTQTGKNRLEGFTTMKTVVFTVITVHCFTLNNRRYLKASFPAGVVRPSVSLPDLATESTADTPAALRAKFTDVNLLLIIWSLGQSLLILVSVDFIDHYNLLSSFIAL